MWAATFVCDVTPPAGSPLNLGNAPSAVGVTHPLSCRGLVLGGHGRPIVVCAIDWVGVAGSGHLAWRVALADAAGTTPDRTTVHTVHQHDAPGSDPDAEMLMVGLGLPGRGHDTAFVNSAIDRAQVAVRAAMADPVPVTDVGIGRAEVIRVASNRRVLGPDSKVRHVRYSATEDPAVRRAPEGIIDPFAHVVSLWNRDALVAVLSSYATHPQSYYRQRMVSHDFVGLARDRVQEIHPLAVHIHLCGAAGNVTAGKYNDGRPSKREILASRLADGIATALEASAHQRSPVNEADIGWRVYPVRLPLAPHLADGAALSNFKAQSTFWAARDLAWADRCERGEEIELSSLRIGPADILHLPSELFIEYQLAARDMCPERFVSVAAYGDYGPGYIGTKVAYSQGGFETGKASRVAPEAEDVLRPAIASLLGKNPDSMESPSAYTHRAPLLE